MMGDGSVPTFSIELGLQAGQLARAAAAAAVRGDPPRRARHLAVHSQRAGLRRLPGAVPATGMGPAHACPATHSLHCTTTADTVNSRHSGTHTVCKQLFARNQNSRRDRVLSRNTKYKLVVGDQKEKL